MGCGWFVGNELIYITGTVPTVPGAAPLCNVTFIVNSTLFYSFYLLSATSYIKYFGYVQFGGVIAAPLCSMLFMEGDSAEQLPAEEDFIMKLKQLILPGFTFISMLIFLDLLQLFENAKLSVGT